MGSMAFAPGTNEVLLSSVNIQYNVAGERGHSSWRRNTYFFAILKFVQLYGGLMQAC